MMQRGRAMAWAMIVRTAVFDEIILERIDNAAVSTLVLNLAAGLDARAWRLKVPASLRWVDVDLPGILDYKVEVLKNENAGLQYEAVRLDLTRREQATGAVRAGGRRIEARARRDRGIVDLPDRGAGRHAGE